MEHPYGGMDRYVRQNLEHEDFNIFRVICRMMRNRTNKLVMKNQMSKPLHIVLSARSFFKDFQKCVAPVRHLGQGVGILARDSRGQHVAWCSNTYVYVTNQHAEALAACFAVDVCCQWNGRSCYIEGDNKLQMHSMDTSVVGPIIREFSQSSLILLSGG
ncbi:hypothetical protein Salat_2132600 [Sesamum alatum]|uniref:Uncharacterized protein n=1 Tax=Sesamum alatum TaxID=300844 RepID=A0AAE2CH30_9LAMI|nr:hypothetical protein Salat_2132600 [Sesamum alatum]